MFDPAQLIESGGLLIITLIIFAETGLLVGFFLPGDTLLLSAGIFAAQGKLPLIPTLILVIFASIAGNIVGYEIGKRNGKKLFKKSDGIFFRREYITRAENFYKNHGGKTILFARFIPVVRTFAAVVAGVGEMKISTFMFYNVIGGFLWGGLVTLFGYWFGSRIPNIDNYILPAVLAATLISFGPMLYHLGKSFLHHRRKKE